MTAVEEGRAKRIADECELPNHLARVEQDPIEPTNVNVDRQMGAYQVLSSLRRRKVRMWVDDGRIVVQCPKGTLLPEDRQKLFEFKPELVALIQCYKVCTQTPIRPRSVDTPRIPLTGVIGLIWDSMVPLKELVSKRTCVTAARLLGPLDQRGLQLSIKAVVQRHESLRTRIVLVKGVPEQRVDACCEHRFEVVDLTGLPPQSREPEVHRVAAGFVEQRIDLSVGPLFKVALIKLSTEEHLFITATDHVVSDGTSDLILCRDIWSVYAAQARGLPTVLPELPVQFGDYAVWQQQTRGASLRVHGSYWTKRLADAPHTRMAFNDGCVGAIQKKCEAWRSSFGGDLSNQLRDLARRESTLLALVVLTIYISLMFCWCNQKELVVLFPESGRHRPELENMIGFLMQVLFLRVEAAPDDSYRDLLGRVNDEFCTACEHGDSNWTSSIQQTSEDALTDLHFNWLPDPIPRHKVAGIDIEPLPYPHPIRTVLGPCIFKPYFSDTPTGIGITVIHSPDLVSESTLEAFAAHLRKVAEAFAQNPLERIGSAWASLLPPRRG